MSLLVFLLSLRMIRIATFSGTIDMIAASLSLMSLLCLSFVSQEDDPNCYLQWNDSYVSSELVSDISPLSFFCLLGG